MKGVDELRASGVGVLLTRTSLSCSPNRSWHRIAYLQWQKRGCSVCSTTSAVLRNSYETLHCNSVIIPHFCKYFKCTNVNSHINAQ